jgi:hypothetical protein
MKLSNKLSEATKTTKGRLLLMRQPKMTIAEAANMVGCNMRSLYSLASRHKHNPVPICPCCGGSANDPDVFQEDALSKLGKKLLNVQLAESRGIK